MLHLPNIDTKSCISFDGFECAIRAASIITNSLKQIMNRNLSPSLSCCISARNKTRQADSGRQTGQQWTPGARPLRLLTLACNRNTNNHPRTYLIQDTNRMEQTRVCTRYIVFVGSKTDARTNEQQVIDHPFFGPHSLADETQLLDNHFTLHIMFLGWISRAYWHPRKQDAECWWMMLSSILGI